MSNTILSLIFSGIVALSTVVYAILTWKLVSETKKMREIQIEPKVFVYVQPREECINVIDIIIKNAGLGPAYDIEFNINPDFQQISGKLLSEIGFLKDGLKYLAPNQKYQFILTVLNSENKKNPKFNIKVTYKNIHKKSYEELFMMDISQFTDFGQIK